MNKYLLVLWHESGTSSQRINCTRYFHIWRIVDVYPRTNRKEESMIWRLYIGHSYLTLSFLLKGEEPQMSIACNERLTIAYILLICSDFIEIRQSHFTAQSPRALFWEIWLEKIFNFLKEISIFDIIFNFEKNFGSVNNFDIIYNIEIKFGSVCLLTTF